MYRYKCIENPLSGVIDSICYIGMHIILPNLLSICSDDQFANIFRLSKKSL